MIPQTLIRKHRQTVEIRSEVPYPMVDYTLSEVDRQLNITQTVIRNCVC